MFHFLYKHKYFHNKHVVKEKILEVNRYSTYKQK